MPQMLCSKYAYKHKHGAQKKLMKKRTKKLYRAKTNYFKYIFILNLYTKYSIV